MEDILRVFGQVHPNKLKSSNFKEIPKFTTFFKQISFTNSNESQAF